MIQERGAITEAMIQSCAEEPVLDDDASGWKRGERGKFHGDPVDLCGWLDFCVEEKGSNMNRPTSLGSDRGAGMATTMCDDDVLDRGRKPTNSIDQRHSTGGNGREAGSGEREYVTRARASEADDGMMLFSQTGEHLSATNPPTGRNRQCRHRICQSL